MQLKNRETEAASAVAVSDSQDSGEICEVSTTVGKDEENENQPFAKVAKDKMSSQDEVIDVESEEKEVKTEPQVIIFGFVLPLLFWILKLNRSTINDQPKIVQKIVQIQVNLIFLSL